MKQDVSRYLGWLESEILSSGNSPRRDCLLAERIAYLARRGRMNEARESLAVLRTYYQAAPKVEVNCWILYADSMVHHFDDLSVEARDRLLRCQALAAASDVPRLDALASAWLALLDYSRNDFSAMDRNVRRALRVAAANDHLVLSRATMVVGLAYLFAGKADLADSWMHRCRAHNSALGDDSTWSSTLHNTAWARLVDLRQKRWAKTASARDYTMTRSSIESAISYDYMTRTQSLLVLNDVLLAQIRSLESDHHVAVEVFDRMLPNAEAHGLAQWLPILMADAAVSKFAVGSDSALQLARDSISRIKPNGHPDDLGATHSRLVDFFQMVGDASAAQAQLEAADQSWTRHAAKQLQILELLGREPLILGEMI